MTKLSLAAFKNQVTDFARPNRFEVAVYLPSVIQKSISHNDIDFINILAQTATLPARTQGEIILKYHGMELKLHGDYSKENLSITFLADYENIARSSFEKWMEYAMQSVNNNNERLPSVQVVNDSILIVRQLGRTEDYVISEYKFFNVFPVSISAIELDMSSENQVERFTVSFAYSHFINKDL